MNVHDIEGYREVKPYYWEKEDGDTVYFIDIRRGISTGSYSKSAVDAMNEKIYKELSNARKEDQP